MGRVVLGGPVTLSSLLTILFLGLVLFLGARVALWGLRLAGRILGLGAIAAALGLAFMYAMSSTRDVAKGENTGFRFPLSEPQVFLKFSGVTEKGVHLGVDLGPGDGETRVFPIAPGRVVCVGWNGGVGPDCGKDAPDPRPRKGLGWFLVIEHHLPPGDEYGRLFSIYGHLASRPEFSIGEDITSVERALGVMGDTGSAHGHPHLHLEIQDGDRWPSFTFGDSEHGFSYAPPDKFDVDAWYERYLDPMVEIRQRLIDERTSSPM